MNDSRGSDGPSLDLIRKLIERKMVDRAVLLGEARWPGAGPLIRLAAAWPELSSQERAARLDEIGPVALARLQSVAELRPELAAVLADLEQRGVVGPADMGQAIAPASAAPDEPVAITALPRDRPAPETQGNDLPPVAAATAREAVERDILLPTVDDQAIAEAAAMLERVHARVQRTIDQAAEIDRPAPAPAPAESIDDGEAFGMDVLSRPLTRGVSREQLAGLRRVAEAAGLPYVELDAASLSRGELYGRLARTGAGVETEAGAFPRAIARPGVVAFIGRLMPRLAERIAEGYCDIPGTNATVRVDPGCRVVIVEPE